MNYKAVAQQLEEIYQTYHHPKYLKQDPLVSVRRFSTPLELEIVGLIASSLSYGRVERIILSIEHILNTVEQDLLNFISNTSLQEKKEVLRLFKHRFNSGLDIALLLESTKRILEENGSLERFFMVCLKREGGIMKAAIARFASQFQESMAALAGVKKGSFTYLMPSPTQGSACKRLNMYLRWMIRPNDGIDLGIWSSLDPSLLLIPLDVHIQAAAKYFCLCKRKSADWKMAEAITSSLRRFDQHDPVRFDFSLCRFGMVSQRSSQKEKGTTKGSA